MVLDPSHDSSARSPRQRSRRPLLGLAVLAITVLANAGSSASAQGLAEASLDKCQRTIGSEASKLASRTFKALATCLGKVSTEVVRRNGGVSGATATCATQLEKIGRVDEKSLAAKFAAKVQAACGGGSHTLGDVLGNGGQGVAQSLDAAAAGARCAAYGGDGTIDSVAEWAQCQRRAQECAVYGALRIEFPRANAWLTQLAAVVPAGPAQAAALEAAQEIAGQGTDCPRNLVVCGELDPCSGATPVVCFKRGDDSDGRGGWAITAPTVISFGTWTNPECGTSGSGWHAGQGSCGTGTGSGFKRCKNILAEAR